MTRQEAVQVVIARCDTIEALRFLEETVIEAVKLKLDFDSVVAYCEKELGIPVKIRPETVKFYALRNNLMWGDDHD